MFTSGTGYPFWLLDKTPKLERSLVAEGVWRSLELDAVNVEVTEQRLESFELLSKSDDLKEWNWKILKKICHIISVYSFEEKSVIVKFPKKCSVKLKTWKLNYVSL